MIIILNWVKHLLMLLMNQLKLLNCHQQVEHHEFSLINPKIEVVRNNNLVFGVGHSSLEGFEFKLFHDKEFKNEFVSTGTTNTLLIGTVGIGTISINNLDDATVTLNYYEDNPNRLFYNVTKKWLYQHI